MGADDAGDGRWMTYAELGLLRGISKESALKLALRQKWRKQRDNHKIVRVCVPLQWAGKRDMGAASRAEPRAEPRADMSHAIRLLETQLQREGARSDAAERRAIQAEARIEAERDRADAAGVQVDQLRRILRDAEAGLTAERAAKANEELRQAAEAHETAQAAVEAETTRLRQASEKAVQDAETLRQELARLTAQAGDAIVASKIDEVQLRRLQEAEQTRKSLGRLARLKAAWRGE